MDAGRCPEESVAPGCAARQACTRTTRTGSLKWSQFWLGVGQLGGLAGDHMPQAGLKRETRRGAPGFDPQSAARIELLRST